ncbi:hypothetical protein CWB96_08960 [Pseudoalteromonas citrea]|uniref:DUF3466 domain-containing protein n=1 Tax=Pseudoalteromonas citrea TaxID=43655 RepID=A0A5S3XSA2_9GAMM|nr:DUF3466 family protein [Pseudoalteromonas citrea]TMP40822.1 hypothetical protein CWB97_16580 [Pseudoalteromonas citrea]TMP59708.1 hypothetical protein CWB96_08960 [Pseudoalteromonas citrea]
MNYIKTMVRSVLSMSVLTACMSHASDLSYTFEDIGSLGGPETAAFDINNAGQVVGWSTRSKQKECESPSGTRVECRFAFVYQAGAMTDLGSSHPNSVESAATAINKHGDIVGNEYFIRNVNGMRYLDSQGVFVEQGQVVPLLFNSSKESASSQAFDINDHGYIVGWMENNDDKDVMVEWSNKHSDAVIRHEHNTFFRRGSATNNLGDVVGMEYERYSYKPNRAFIQTSKGVSLLLKSDSIWSEANEINDYGMVAGAQSPKAFRPSEATIWYPSITGELTAHVVGGIGKDIRELSAFHDINRQGTAVGKSENPERGSLAIVYYKGELLDLNTITNVPGTLVEAMGINEQGDIVGSYIDLNNNTRGFVLKQQ